MTKWLVIVGFRNPEIADILYTDGGEDYKEEIPLVLDPTGENFYLEENAPDTEEVTYFRTVGGGEDEVYGFLLAEGTGDLPEVEAYQQEALPWLEAAKNIAAKYGHPEEPAIHVLSYYE